MHATTSHDEPRDIRDRLEGVNVPTAERLAFIGAGSLAALLGARMRSLPGALLAGAGVLAVLRGVTGRCPVYRRRATGHGVDLHRSILIQAPRSKVYLTWRDLPGLRRFFEHVSSIEERDAKTSRWVAAIGPVSIAWDAELVDELPGRRLSWRSLPGGDVEHEGSIELSEYPDQRSTLLNVQMRFTPPAASVTSLFRGLVRAWTEHQLAMDLIRFRQFIETGEIATGAMRPEQPAAETSPAMA